MRISHWTVGKQITVGFGILMAGLAAIAAWSILGIGGIVGDAKVVIGGNKLRGDMVQKIIDHMNWACAVSDLLNDETVTQLNVQTDPRHCAFGQWYYSEARRQAEAMVPAIADDLRQIEPWHNQLHGSAVEVARHFVQADLMLSAELQQKKVDHLLWASRVKDVFLDESRNRTDVQTDPHKCAFGQWYYSDHGKNLAAKDPTFAQIYQAIEEPHSKLHASATQIEQHLAEGKRQEAQTFYRETTEPTALDVCAHIDEMIAWNNTQVRGMQDAQNVFAAKTKPSLEKVQHHLNNIQEQVTKNVMTDDQMLNAAASVRLAVVFLSGLLIAVGLATAYLIVRGIKRVLTAIVKDLSQGAAEVYEAANQVASSSQSLAEGTTEQAAGLEETSSSLEEMSSMTRQNADNAQQANALASEARQAAETGAEAMSRMSQAIDGIQKSSDETAKILKVIDEIAFQTNLLALNAAVEAARAGEAGKGFAVVAEEVRNLAMRSAEAAQNTANMIEESIKNSRNGVAISEQVNQSLQAIVGSVTKTTDLVGEIAAASQEQAQGIEQVNTAVSQMDKVTQQNAANAEESASASEEMSAQAEQLKGIVGELTRLVQGQSAAALKSSITQRHPSIRASHADSNRLYHQIADGKRDAAPRTARDKVSASIPMDDGFDDFSK